MLDRMAVRLLIFALLYLTACSPLTQESETEIVTSTQEEVSARKNTPTVEDLFPSSPANRGEEEQLEFQFPDQIPYDAILPIYEPEFVHSAESPLEEDELVMGVALNGEAKVYPVTVLRIREMVNDELGGIPILVTW